MSTLRFCAGLLILLASLHGQVNQDWTHYVRIAGHGLRLDSGGDCDTIPNFCGSEAATIAAHGYCREQPISRVIRLAVPKRGYSQLPASNNSTHGQRSGCDVTGSIPKP